VIRTEAKHVTKDHSISKSSE